MVTLGALERIGGVGTDAMASSALTPFTSKYRDDRCLEQAMDIGVPLSGFLLANSESVMHDCAWAAGPTSLHDLLEKGEVITVVTMK